MVIREECVEGEYVLAGIIGYKPTVLVGSSGVTCTYFIAAFSKHHVTFVFFVSSFIHPPSPLININKHGNKYHVITRLQSPNHGRNCLRCRCSRFRTCI